MKLARNHGFNSILKVIFVVCVLSIFSIQGCTRKTAELGSKKNPVKLYFVPAVDALVLETNAQKFKEYLEKNTPYTFEISIPQSFIALSPSI